ncbi:MAG: exodeoxyribonuclease VII small subunit [Clostridiales bacterium]|nr:exodeoxyribonuclease VII small subunit [Clostridiales bacterium]
MKKMTYEQAIKRLEEIVSTLEKGEASLDDSLKLFKEGTELSAFCSDFLDKADLKISELSDIKIDEEVE